MTVVSLSIGQGEVTMTPLQMANSVCAIANRGYYIQPHFLKNVLDEDIEKDKYLNFDTVQIPIDRGIFDLVAEAMEKVVTAGTASQARVDSIVICGKTGTAQNPGGADHSVFIAFAPKDNPKIAIAVIVENSGWGNSWAAPITALMIEKYLKGRITDQNKLNRILEADLLNVKPTPKKK
jgi:penicillin-binding protein 2